MFVLCKYANGARFVGVFRAFFIKLKKLVKTSSIGHLFVPRSFDVLGISGEFNKRYFLHRSYAHLSFLVMCYALLILSLAGGLGAV